MTVLLVTALVGWAAPPSAAHGALLFSDPPESGVLEKLPSRARLTFSDTIAEIREITVLGPGGSVTNGAPTSMGAEVTQTLWAGVDGEYVLEYFVVAADGHDVRGEVRFEVESGEAAAPSGGVADVSPAVTTEESWWRRGRASVLPLGLVLTAAVAALALLHRRRREPVTDD
jgi:methionine-rich copper-binding protein CopC